MGTSSYTLCHIIIHTMSHHHTYYVTSSYTLCHIIIHTMSHHHTHYVTSSYILCHIIIHTMSHHHTHNRYQRRPDRGQNLAQPRRRHQLGSISLDVNTVAALCALMMM